MMATSGVKSNMPVLGIIRRRGAKTSSVTRYRITAGLLVGLGENQDMIARAIISKVNT